MTYVYKAKCYAIIKVGGIPIKIQQDTVFHCATNLLLMDLDIKLDDFEELIDNEWISLAILKERNF
jgi:hypothetical protein